MPWYKGTIGGEKEMALAGLVSVETLIRGEWTQE